MLHLLEALTQVAAYPHGGRIGVGKFGMPSLQILQLVHHKVKFLVANNRLIQHIIAIIMLMQRLSQCDNSGFLIHYHTSLLFYLIIYKPIFYV